MYDYMYNYLIIHDFIKSICFVYIYYLYVIINYSTINYLFL